MLHNFKKRHFPIISLDLKNGQDILKVRNFEIIYPATSGYLIVLYLKLASKRGSHKTLNIQKRLANISKKTLLPETIKKLNAC